MRVPHENRLHVIEGRQVLVDEVVAWRQTPQANSKERIVGEVRRAEDRGPIPLDQKSTRAQVGDVNASRCRYLWLRSVPRVSIGGDEVGPSRRRSAARRRCSSTWVSPASATEAHISKRPKMARHLVMCISNTIR